MRARYLRRQRRFDRMGRDRVRQAIDMGDFTDRTRRRAIQWLHFDHAETQRKKKQHLMIMSVAIAIGIFIVLKGTEIYLDGSIDFEAVGEVFNVWFGGSA